MNSQIETLYVIGNGFDLHHDVASSYFGFRNYVKCHNNEVYDYCEQFLPVEKNWSDLESAFGHVDPYDIQDEGNEYLVSYGAEDWSDDNHHVVQRVVEEITLSLSQGLLELFKSWLLTLEIPNYRSVKQPLQFKRDKSAYLSFNYTNTLSKTYRIPKSDVVFIHGCIEEVEDIVLGHAWIQENTVESHTDENTDPRIADCAYYLDKYFKDTFKPTTEIIELNSDFFTSINSVKEVFVLGHSMRQVDHDYFKAVLSSIDSNARWAITYFSDDCLIDIKSQCQLLGINLSKVKFVKMNELTV